MPTDLPPLPPAIHGECPACSQRLDGDGIWLHFFWEEYRVSRDHLAAERKADESAALFGATRWEGRWGLGIGIVENDRCSKTACPACGAIWDNQGKLLDERFDHVAFAERRNA